MKVMALPSIVMAIIEITAARSCGDSMHDECQQRRLAGGLAALRPGDEQLHAHDAADDHDERRGQAEHAERRGVLREQQAPVVEVVESKADQRDRHRGEHDAQPVDPDVRHFLDRRQVPAQQQHADRERDQQPERVAPPEVRAHDARHEESDDRGDGLHGAEHAEGGRLLLALVVMRRQHDERRDDRCGRQPGQGLRRDHHCGTGTRRHDHHGGEEDGGHPPEHAQRAELLAEPGAEHREAGHAE